MTYPDSVRFLYALGNEIKTAKLGLERIQAVLAALRNPHLSYRVIHVAGTNGKGSTCAMIDAGLRAAHVRTGLFTSPHLIEPTERIQIDGIPVTEFQFRQAFETVHRAAEPLNLDCHPTYFETVTAMAFWLFRELGVHTAVIETGLGGRLDATNVVHPALTVITPIDFDHEAYLGHTIEAIASEKAGILKPRVQAVFATQRKEAAAVLEARAKELAVPYLWADDYQIRDLTLTSRGSTFNGIHCPLAGEHQVDNAVTALLSLQSLGVPPEGISEATWPGRLEVVSPNPDIILDGAHNPAGARALVRYLTRFYAGRKIWMIYGAMRDKAIDEVAGILFQAANEIILTAPDSARALRPEAILGNYIHPEFAPHARTAPNIASALDLFQHALFQHHASADDVCVITGSLYLVGEARQGFLNQPRQPYA